MCVCIITPAEDACIGEIVREEVAQPVDAVACRPCLLAVSIQAMDGDDARSRLVWAIEYKDEAYSTTGLVPSDTTCKPWITMPAGSVEGEDAEGPVVACLSFSWCVGARFWEVYVRFGAL